MGQIECIYQTVNLKYPNDEDKLPFRAFSTFIKYFMLIDCVRIFRIFTCVPSICGVYSNMVVVRYGRYVLSFWLLLTCWLRFPRRITDDNISFYFPSTLFLFLFDMNMSIFLIDWIFVCLFVFIRLGTIAAVQHKYRIIWFGCIATAIREHLEHWKCPNRNWNLFNWHAVLRFEVSWSGSNDYHRSHFKSSHQQCYRISVSTQENLPACVSICIRFLSTVWSGSVHSQNLFPAFEIN